MSDVVELIVCDQEGQVTKENKGKIATVSQEGKRIYSFFAIKDPNGAVKDYKHVRLTMPVGGTQNGLLRLPKIGEHILVIVQGNEYYLMAYLPNEEDMEFRKDADEKDSTDNEALTLRYNSPNKLPVESKTKGDNLFSELKFSTKETFWPTKGIDVYKKAGKWKDSNDNEYNEDDVVVNKNDGTKGQVDNESCDKIDRINLTSTGDLITTAGNFNEINARRIALISDQDVDESELKKILKGDINCSASHNINLKADEKITIQCGHSAIILSEDGIQLISAKVNPATPVGNDSQITLSPRTGVSIAGSNVELDATTSFTISEGCGASISSVAGMTRIYARDVQMASQNSLQAGLTFAQSVANFFSIGNAYSDAESKFNKFVRNKGASLLGSVNDFCSWGWDFKDAFETGVQNASSEVSKSGDETGHFTDGSKGACACIADLVLSIGSLFLQVQNLVFTNMENSFNGDDYGSYITKLNKASHWAEQGIVELMDGICLASDVLNIFGARIQTGVDVGAIRFHGGYGDITCASLEEMSIQDIEGCSPTAASAFAMAEAGAGVITSMVEGINTLLEKSDEDEKELGLL